MKNRRPFLSLVLTLATGALAPLASGQLFVTTLEALEVTADAAVLQIDLTSQPWEYSVNAGFLLEEQNSETGLFSNVGEVDVFLIFDHEVPGVLFANESYISEDLQGMVDIGVGNPVFDPFTQRSTSELSLAFSSLSPGTAYRIETYNIFRSSGWNYDEGETLSFTTL
ncbi:MAG: hypothetical protein ACLFR7_01925, partial [Opitutales bacterium]